MLHVRKVPLAILVFVTDYPETLRDYVETFI